MVLELLTAIFLLFQFPEAKVFWANMFMLSLIWLSTFFLSVPLHNSLSQKQDLIIIKKLVATNWVRTVLWTARLLLLLTFFLKYLEINYVRV